VSAKESQHEHFKEGTQWPGRYGNRAKEGLPRIVLNPHEEEGHEKSAEQPQKLCGTLPEAWRGT
jgi:hypothetical protein